MRSNDAWEGLRSRWSMSDSAGASISDVSEVVLPSLVVGFEERDGKQLNYGSAFIVTAGGEFGQINFGCTVDTWLEEVTTFLHTGNDLFRMSLDPRDEAATTGDFVRPPGPALYLTTALKLLAPTDGARLPKLPQAGGADIGRCGLKFERPGWFMAAGSSVEVTSETVGADFACGFLARLA